MYTHIYIYIYIYITTSLLRMWFLCYEGEEKKKDKS